MRTRVASLWIAILLSSGLPLSSTAGDPPTDAHAEELKKRIESFEAQEAEEEKLRQEWQKREAERMHAIKAARKHLAEVEANRVRAHDGEYAGVKRSEWTERSKKAKQELTEAERELDEFHEEARQADVPPGWMNEE